MSLPVGPVVLAVCAAALVFTMVRAMRSRSRFARVRTGPLGGASTGALAPGTAGALPDAGQVRAQDLLDALSLRAAQDADADLDDEGTGARLGLAYHRYRHTSGNLWDPTVYDGARYNAQVFLRLGRAMSARGPGINQRRLRSVSVVRVAVAPFELTASDGRLVSQHALPAPLATALAHIGPSPEVWHDLRVIGGPDGIAASRGTAQDWVGGWIYDLWLLERIAACLSGRPLPFETLGREWRPPYGLDDWAPTVGETLHG